MLIGIFFFYKTYILVNLKITDFDLIFELHFVLHECEKRHKSGKMSKSQEK